MVDLIFEMNTGTGFMQVPPPENWKGIMPSILFTDQQPNGQITDLDLKWGGENATRLNAIRQQAITGTRSLYLAVPLRIRACNTETPWFDGYINLASINTSWECDSVTAPCVEKGRADWLSDVAGGESFSTLATLAANIPGAIIPGTHYKRIPYCRNDHRNEGLTTAMLAISEYIVIEEIIDLAKEVPTIIQELIAKVTAATLTLGATVSLVVCEVIKTVLYIIKIALMIVAIVAMLASIMDNIWQSKKHKLGMREEDCWKVICARFNLGFASTIYSPTSPFKNATHIPYKTVIPSVNNPLTVFQRPFDEGVNFPNNPDVYGHPDDPTLQDFIVRMCTKYNAGIDIINGTLHFEEVHHFNNTSTFQIPNTDEVGDTFNLPQPNGTNAGECAANYLFKFSTDQSDLNTIRRYKGTSCEIQVRPASVPNIQMLSEQLGVQVLIPEALAKRKEYLSKVEHALNSLINGVFQLCNTITSLINSLLNALNSVISAFGGNTTTVPTIPQLPTNILNNRLGWMEITDDSFNVPKTFIGQAQGSDWVISPASESVMSAYNFMQTFHGKNLATRGNQQLIYKDRQFKFCCPDANALKNRNIATSPNNLPAKFRGKLVWDIHNNMIRDAEWGEFKKWDNNLTEKIIIDGK